MRKKTKKTASFKLYEFSGRATVFGLNQKKIKKQEETD
jgi:hypothetical protein